MKDKIGTCKKFQYTRAITHHSITFDDALFSPTISVDKSVRFNINVHVLQRIGWGFVLLSLYNVDWQALKFGKF